MSNSHFHSAKSTECDEVSLDLRESEAVIKLAGEVDIEVRPCFRKVLEELRNFHGPVSIDAQEVDFIDSSGIAILGEIAKEHPDHVTIFNAPPTMMFILEITTLIDSVHIASRRTTV